MKKLGFILLLLIGCGKDLNQVQNKIEAEHQLVEIKNVNFNLNTLVNKKIKLTGIYSVSYLDSCLMDAQEAICIEVDPQFFSRYAALDGQSLTLYGILRYSENLGLGQLEVYYFKDQYSQIKKVAGRDY